MSKKSIILIALTAVAALCALGILIFGDYEISVKNEIYLQNPNTGEYVCVEERTCVITNKTPECNPSSRTGYVVDYNESKLKISSFGAFFGWSKFKTYYACPICRISFDGDGGELVSGEEIIELRAGADIEMPVYKKDGYVFMGFKRVGQTSVSTDKTFYEDAELIAVWEPCE